MHKLNLLTLQGFFTWNDNIIDFYNIFNIISN